MKKTERKELEVKMFTSLGKVIKDNKVDLTNKMEKVIKKALRQVAEKSKKQKVKSLKKEG